MSRRFRSIKTTVHRPWQRAARAPACPGPSERVASAARQRAGSADHEDRHRRQWGHGLRLWRAPGRCRQRAVDAGSLAGAHRGDAQQRPALPGGERRSHGRGERHDRCRRGGSLRARDRRHQGHGHRGRGARRGADDRAGQPGARDPERPRQCRAHPEGRERRQPAVRHRRRLRRRDPGAGPRPSQRHGGDQPRRAVRRHLGAARAGRRRLARGGLHRQPVRRPLAGGVEQAGAPTSRSARSAR